MIECFQITDSLYLLRLKDFMKTSELQFGFKENVGCVHAIYTVKSVLNYFNKQGSTVTMAALDIFQSI